MSIRELSPELAKKAKDELFEDPKRIPQDLQAIKSWIAKQPHLSARTDDQWLVGFLRGCKYSLERTKEKLDLFYTMRTAIPELCEIVDPMDPKVQEILSLGLLVVLPKSKKPDDPRILIMRPGVCDPDKISFTDVMRINNTIFCSLIMDDDQLVIAGSKVLADMNNMSMGHLTQVTPSLLKKMVISGQEANPIRQKGAHHINMPSAAETIMGLVLRLMNEKNRSRLFIHKDMDDLYKHIPKNILPTEYGGDAGPIQAMIDETKKRLESNRDWFLEEMKYKTIESKRPGKPKTAETIFGIEGSFRQLNLD